MSKYGMFVKYDVRKRIGGCHDSAAELHAVIVNTKCWKLEREKKIIK